MGHHRCYRKKATNSYILSAFDGVEFLDVETGGVQVHNYVRGACNLGVMPSNGLLYAPPHACACNAHIRLPGFLALAGPREDPVAGTEQTTRLERGPAWNDSDFSPPSGDDAESAGPTYRQDSGRSADEIYYDVKALINSRFQADKGYWGGQKAGHVNRTSGNMKIMTTYAEEDWEIPNPWQIIDFNLSGATEEAGFEGSGCSSFNQMFTLAAIRRKYPKMSS